MSMLHIFEHACVGDSMLYLHMSNILKGSGWRQLRSARVVLITYLHALVSVAQAQLPAGHHGLLGGPGLSTDQAPALGPVRVGAQHFHAALVTGPSSRDPDLCGAERVRDDRAEAETHAAAGLDKN